MSNHLCRWGFLGTATISQKNWHAIRLVENATLVAVASRDANRSRQFVERCQTAVPFPQTPTAISSYDELIQREDIDAVYIPLPTGIRKQWVLKAANAGKHVMCEKPCAVNSDELSEMLAACERNHVQFMDGVMFMHSKRLNALRVVLDDRGQLGLIRRIYSQFSFHADDEFGKSNIRTDSQLEPHGCVGDLGWYNIRFLLWVLNWEMPSRVRASTLAESKRTNEAVPTEFIADLYFENGVSAGFYCSFKADHQQWANVSGTKGFIHIKDFVLPFSGERIGFELNQTEFLVEHCQFEMRENCSMHAVNEPANNASHAQEANLFRNFSAIVLSGKTDRFWFDVAAKTQSVMDACMLSARRKGELLELGKW